MTKRKFFEVAAVSLGFVGTIFIFFSLQLAKTEIRFVPVQMPIDGVVSNLEALCFGGQAMFMWGPKDNTMIAGTACPNASSGNPIALINTDNPELGSAGLMMIGLSFLIQLLLLIKTEKHLSRAEQRRKQ